MPETQERALVPIERSSSSFIDPASIDLNAVVELPEMELNKLPFGVVKLDLKGDISFYNDWEQRLIGLPRYLALKCNFFDDLAPCTRVANFEGRFRSYVEGRSKAMQEMFDFTFTLRQFHSVKIIFAPGADRHSVYLLVVKQAAPENGETAWHEQIDFTAVQNMTYPELDMMNYGVVTVDQNADILFLNDWEARLKGIAREKFIGKNWFKDIAPCTRVPAFEGRFRQFVRGEAAMPSEAFDFVYPISSGTHYVKVLFVPGKKPGTVHIVITKAAPPVR